MTTYEQWIALMTIMRREVARFIRIWTQTLLPPVITQSLYFVIFGKFIGARIGMMQGLDYITFIVPGLVMMAVINSSYANVVSSFFSTKFQRNIEELLVSPTPHWIIVTGYMMGGVLRGLWVGLLVFGTSFIFARPVIDHPGIILIFILATAVCFSLGGFLNALFAKKFDDVSIFPTFVLTPLTYLGGVFYTIQYLPPLWQNVSKLNPILYMVNGFRYGFYGVSDVPVTVSLLLLVVFIVFLMCLNVTLLKKGTGLKT